MKSRKERREEARNNDVKFEPVYNGRVITKAEYDKEVQEYKELKKELKEKGFIKDFEKEDKAE